MRGKKKIAAQLLLVLPAIVLLNTGCLTPMLWKAEVRQPVRNPHLSLSAASDNSDVLVQYDEHQSDKVHHRSYWLFEYVSNKGGEGRPRFLRPAAYTNLDLTPIPLARPPADGVQPAAGYIAARGDEHWSFELSRDGAPLGHFDLPVYEVDAKPTFGRVALTPLAAIGDGVIAVGASVTIVGGAALILAAESSLDDDEWADFSNSSGSSCHTSHKSGGLHATRRSD